MKGYAKIAPYYDRFVNDDFYKTLLSYLSGKVIPLHGSNFLDLGTGTGFFPIYYAKLGMRSVGIDKDKEMIKIAKGRAKDEELDNIEFIHHNILSFKTNERFSYVTMFFDVLNHFHTASDISKLFSNVHEHLEDGGFFIFDILSQWGMKKMWGNDKFFEYYDDFKILWVSQWDSSKQCLTVTMKIFSGKQVIKETFIEKAYQRKTIEEKLADAGFELQGVTPLFFFKRRPSRYLFHVKKI